MPQIDTTPTSILARVNSTVDVPAMPEVLIKLAEIIAKPGTSAEDVARVVSEDPRVSSNILRIVNSAYYGLQVRVSSLSLAISLMGFKMTRKVALKAAVFATFSERREPCEQFDPLSFWKHAVYAGVAARSLASASEVFANIHPEDVYMAGLLHDIGRIICMEDQGSRHLESMHKSPQENRSEVGHEFEHSGLTHADVGSAMASRWSLPANLINAIKYNRAPLRDPFEQPLSALVHLASHLAKRAQATPTLGAALSSLNHDVYESIALSLEQVEEILPQIADDFTVAELPW